MSATAHNVAKTFSIAQTQIDAYADVADDHNPLHLNAEFARQRGFEGTIAHGLLTLGLISAALADEWGATWAESGRLDVRLAAPVLSGSEVTLEVTSAEAPTNDRADFELVARVGERIVVSGTASVAA